MMSKWLKGLIWPVLFFIALGAYSFWPRNDAKEIAGAQTQADPNHPQEVYYGSREFEDLPAMIEDLAVTVYPEDKVNALPDPILRLGSQITIKRATPVEVTDAKVVRIYRTWKTNVQELLVENNLELIAQDSIEPSLETPVSYNMKVKITRVAEFDLTEKEPIDYKVIKKYNNSLEKGNKNILQKGHDGEKSVTYHIKRIDGEEVSRKVLDTQILSEPVEEIQEIGTWVKVYDNNGIASWYGVWPKVARLANNAYYAAAHDLGTYPRGTVLWVVNKANGKGVKVTVLDYMENPNCTLDLSKAAFSSIASLGAGIIDIRIEKYYPNS